jgi:hypothetical protein
MRLPPPRSGLLQRTREAAASDAPSAPGEASSAGRHADAAGIFRRPPTAAHTPPAPAGIRAGILDLTEVE